MNRRSEGPEVTTRYAPRCFIGSFPDEARALDNIRLGQASLDESCPPDRRFRLALFRAAKLEDSGHGYKVLPLGEEEFVLYEVPGACEVFHAMSDMITDSEEEAKAWIEEAQAMGAPPHWRIFTR
jgi:hypothetical protein